ncbi:hypothetical protein [Bacillus sp. FJAT-29814]|uniref:hypothetical protein n=1 Tax=Bacillus sp. FJAT-29814 TaxID=1729688 RepID=UPI00082BD500|nr:hypothetical protein [Bacillus sp. FJAT-29814]
MAQIAFFVAGAAPGVGGLGLLLAWDRFNKGPSAADSLNTDGCGLYTWTGLTTGALLVKALTKEPIQIPDENLPTYPDGFPSGDFFNRIVIKPGGSGLGLIHDISFEIFDGSKKIYGADLKFEIAKNSILPMEVSIQDKLTMQPFLDPLEGFAEKTFFNFSTPCNELWRSLMTPNKPLDWWGRF